jgi:hypothetical protein
MRGEVEFGTRHRAREDGPIAGKTGTCSENHTHLGWFGAFHDVGDRKLAVVVLLLTGGGPAIGPLAAGIAGDAYGGLGEKNYFRAAQAMTPATLVSSQICCSKSAVSGGARESNFRLKRNGLRLSRECIPQARGTGHDDRQNDLPEGSDLRPGERSCQAPFQIALKRPLLIDGPVHALIGASFSEGLRFAGPLSWSRVFRQSDSRLTFEKPAGSQFCCTECPADLAPCAGPQLLRGF